MPKRVLPLSSTQTEKASSISVVVSSSMLNAGVGASGRSAGKLTGGIAAKAVPCGKCWNRK